MEDCIDNNSWDNHYFNDIEFELIPSLPPLPEECLFQAISSDSKTFSLEGKNGDINTSKFYCKVAQYNWTISFILTVSFTNRILYKLKQYHNDHGTHIKTRISTNIIHFTFHR